MTAKVQVPASETEYWREIVEKPELLRTIDSRAYSSGQMLALLDMVKEQNKKLPGEKEVTAFFAGLTQQQLEDYARALRERLRQETAVLDWLDKEGLDPFAPDLREIELPYPVEHVTAEQLYEINPFHREVGACYRGGMIYVGPNLPDLRDRLTLLATRGILSNDLFHEVYHGHQDGDVHYASLEDVLHSLVNPHASEWKLALAESHAWIASLRGFRDEVLLPVIQSSYEIENVEYLEHAFRIVNGLNTLGVSDRRLGELIGRTHWDDQVGQYAALEHELRRLAEEKGHDRETLAAEIEQRKVMERIQALRAMGIAAEYCAN